ncbi:MAG: FtsQ-type POTRA domain-containing protein [Actinobacteria bacterium]|nr:FtsQ-type POTRA domain-containing protein [Actinomycetota bacterium]
MRVIRWIVALVVAAGLGFGGSVLWRSSLLELRRVEVAGNSELSKEEVVAETGLRRGVHLLSVDTGTVAGRVRSNPWIDDVRVERILPSTIRISVNERTPVALITAITGTYLIDGSGVVLEQGQRDLLLIEDVTPEVVEPGTTLDLPQLRHVFEILPELDPSLSARLKSVSARSVDRITFVLDTDTRILFGAAEEIEEKNFAARALLKRAETDSKVIEYLDVRVPGRPAVRYR